MAKTPDPSYWGNPPETPRSKYDPRNTQYQQPAPQPGQPVPQSQQQPPQQPTAAPQQGVPQAGQQTEPQPAGQPLSQPAEPATAPQPGAAQPNQTASASSAQPNQATPASSAQPNQEQAGQPYPFDQTQAYNPAAAAAPQQQPYQADGTIPPNSANPYQQPQPPKSKKPLIIGIIAAILVLCVIVFAGCSVFNAIQDSVFSSVDEFSSEISVPDTNGEEDPGYDETENLNVSFRDHFDLDHGESGKNESSISTDELNTIKNDYFKMKSTSPDKDGEYDEGVYYVGQDLPADSYWFEGDDDHLAYFFILQPSSVNEGAYDVVHINEYYGHNLMDLEEGEVFILDNDDSMEPLDKMHETFEDPYESGTYRVGTDVPAGTYYVAPGEAKNNYCAYYIMTDLKYTDSSYRDVDYLIEGDEPLEITLNEGEYIELYNATMSSSNTIAMGTKTKV